MPRQREKKRKLKLSRVIMLAVILLLIIGFGTGLGFLLGIAKSVPDWSASDMESANTSFVYDMNGDLVVQLHNEENRTPVELSEISPYLVDAFLATEDVRFYQHHGIDIRRIAGAFVADIRNRSFAEGASTITMQLVRTAILENQEKKIERKIKEALLALDVERRYTKDEILDLYLNEIYFGHGANGVQAASQIYFGKDAKDLTLAEAATLTGLVRNPRNYSPFLNPENALHIRAVVLDNMVRYNKISQSEADAAKSEKLALAEYKSSASYEYPWFTDYVIDQAGDLLKEAGFDPGLLYTGGLRIYSTMDPVAQAAAEKAYLKEGNFPKSNSADPIQSAMSVMDPSTGEIRAIIGGREHLTQRGLNRATDIKRQPGSSIKPVSVYAPCLEKGYSPSSVVDDVPVTFGTSANPYQPENYDGRYRGLITMREAVQYSVNIPAVKFLNEIGVSTGFNFAKKLGLPLEDPGDKNLSLALGGLTRGISPLDLTAAYSAFDNQGVYIKPHVISKIVDKDGNTIVEINPEKNIAMSEETAYLMTDMLKTVVDRGTGTNARMNRPVAGKTGTTQLPDKKGFRNLKGNKDAWFAGYTPELVGVVWMGYDDDYDKNGKAQYLSKVYGGQYPAKIWKSVMEASLKNTPVKAFPRPGGIVSSAIDIKSGTLASDMTPDQFIRMELFAKKNMPTATSDIWVAANICPESHLLATDACPVKISGVFLKRSGTGKGANDSDLTLPTAYCSIHGGTPQETSTQLYAICNDPRHHGKPYLANMPEDGESGGCPQEYITFEMIDPSDHLPSCDLEDHQVKKDE